MGKCRCNELQISNFCFWPLDLGHLTRFVICKFKQLRLEAFDKICNMQIQATAFMILFQLMCLITFQYNTEKKYPAYFTNSSLVAKCFIIVWASPLLYNWFSCNLKTKGRWFETFLTLSDKHFDGSLIIIVWGYETSPWRGEV